MLSAHFSRLSSSPVPLPTNLLLAPLPREDRPRIDLEARERLVPDVPLRTIQVNIEENSAFIQSDNRVFKNLVIVDHIFLSSKFYKLKGFLSIFAKKSYHEF